MFKEENKMKKFCAVVIAAFALMAIAADAAEARGGFHMSFHPSFHPSYHPSFHEPSFRGVHEEPSYRPSGFRWMYFYHGKGGSSPTATPDVNQNQDVQVPMALHPEEISLLELVIGIAFVVFLVIAGSGVAMSRS
jgi:hypothetical protein